MLQMYNGSSTVTLLIVLAKQCILKLDKYTIYEYILIQSKHQSTNIVSPVVFNLCTT